MEFLMWHTCKNIKSVVTVIKSMCLMLLLLPLHIHADTKNSMGGFLDFNVYPQLTDVDNDSIFSLNIAAKLPNRLSYFSLLNLINQDGSSNISDSTNYYTEQNIRWQISENSPLDFTVQLNFRSGEDNDRHRFGLRWRLSDTSFLQTIFRKINLSYAVNLHAIQFDHEDANVWQLEHSLMMKFPFISKRLYLSAFADHTFNQDLPAHLPGSPIVAEVQLGYRMVDNFYLVTEYRLNQYRTSDVNNLAFGAQYKVIW